MSTADVPLPTPGALAAICATIHENRERGRAVGLQHCSHEHLLILMEQIDNGAGGEDVSCNGCGLVIRGCAYSCSTKCRFHLHELCALLPSRVEHHPEHPEHPLILLPQSPYPSSRFQCNVCNKNGLSGFTYHCSLCKFDADLRCAALPLHVHDPSHEHPLTPWLYPATFQCSACGGKHDEGLSYRCTTCPFWIHDHCYSLPRIIQHGSHVHPLTLAYAVVCPPSHVPVCGICEEKINNIYWFYCCQGCNYCVHVKCSEKKRETEIEMDDGQDEEKAKLIKLPVPNVRSVHQMINRFIKQMCQLEDSNRDEAVDYELHHSSHEHPLVLCHVQSMPSDNKLCPEFVIKFSDLSIKQKNNDIICNACMLPISNPPFYNCRYPCSFYLHEWCAKLPDDLHHSGHQGHTLVLVKKNTEWFGFFRCKGCGQIGNGFAYKCTECQDYYIDVKCASLPSSIMHETHEHPLLLKQGRFIGGCSSCGDSLSGITFGCDTCKFGSCTTSSSYGLSFGCDACHFSLDVKCSLLPREITHRYDEHPFTLTYSSPMPTEDDDLEHECYCEFCETKVPFKSWFYHCVDCDKSAGAKCISRAINLFSIVKFGGVYESPHHQHPLTCVQATNTWSKSCDRCHEKCYCGNFAFQCSICKIILDLKCACSPS